MPESEPQQTPVEPPADAAAPPSPSPAAERPSAEDKTEPAAPPLEEQVAAARQEAAVNYDRYLRAVADLENYRRRAAREKDELRLSANANLMMHLLPVADSLQLAVNAARPEAAAKMIADGVAIALEQFKGVLSRHGLKELNPVGQKFDPHQHEPLAHQPSAEVPEEHVLQVVRVGYSLHGRVLRPASVILSGGPEKEAKG
jgi:molecular chaperone GrpE